MVRTDVQEVCSWDHVTKANPDGLPCGRPSKYEVNGPNGYFVCGIHKRSAEAIGEVDIRLMCPRCHGQGVIHVAIGGNVGLGLCPGCGGHSETPWSRWWRGRSTPRSAGTAPNDGDLDPTPKSHQNGS